MGRRRFSLNIIYGFFFHFITFVRIRSRESFFAYFEPDPTQGSRSTSGCKIIKIFMVSCRFFGIKREASFFKVLPCSKTLKTPMIKENLITMGVWWNERRKKCVFSMICWKRRLGPILSSSFSPTWLSIHLSCFFVKFNNSLFSFFLINLTGRDSFQKCCYYKAKKRRKNTNAEHWKRVEVEETQNWKRFGDWKREEI